MRIKLSFVGLFLGAAIAAVGCGGGEGGTTGGAATKESAAASAPPPASTPAPASAAPAESAAPAATGESADDGKDDGKDDDDDDDKDAKKGKGKKGKGHKGKKGKHGKKGKKGGDEGGEAELNQEWVHIPKVNVELRTPKGWKENKRKNWVIFKSPDGNAWLGFVEYQSGPEATKKLAEVAEMFDAHDIKWSAVRNEKLGEGQFPSKVADGECKLKGGGEGDISYAAVNPPGKGEMLIVYVVHKTKGHPMARPAAIASIKSMRRKK